MGDGVCCGLGTTFLAEGYIGSLHNVTAGSLPWSAGLGVAKAAPLFGAWLSVA